MGVGDFNLDSDFRESMKSLLHKIVQMPYVVDAVCGVDSNYI